MNEKFRKIAPPVGRVLLAQIFLTSGFSKIFGWSGAAAYMTSKGMPAAPFFLFMAIVLEIGGGLAVAAGYKTRLGVLALVVFLAPTTVIFHDFWSYEGQEARMQLIEFKKNLALLGGLILLAGLGPGAYSLDGAGTRR